MDGWSPYSPVWFDGHTHSYSTSGYPTDGTTAADHNTGSAGAAANISAQNIAGSGANQPISTPGSPGSPSLPDPVEFSVYSVRDSASDPDWAGGHGPCDIGDEATDGRSLHGADGARGTAGCVATSTPLSRETKEPMKRQQMPTLSFDLGDPFAEDDGSSSAVKKSRFSADQSGKLRDETVSSSEKSRASGEGLSLVQRLVKAAEEDDDSSPDPSGEQKNTSVPKKHKRAKFSVPTTETPSETHQFAQLFFSSDTFSRRLAVACGEEDPENFLPGSRTWIRCGGAAKTGDPSSTQDSSEASLGETIRSDSSRSVGASGGSQDSAISYSEPSPFDRSSSSSYVPSSSSHSGSSGTSLSKSTGSEGSSSQKSTAAEVSEAAAGSEGSSSQKSTAAEVSEAAAGSEGSSSQKSTAAGVSEAAAGSTVSASPETYGPISAGYATPTPLHYAPRQTTFSPSPSTVKMVEEFDRRVSSLDQKLQDSLNHKDISAALAGSVTKMDVSGDSDLAATPELQQKVRSARDEMNSARSSFESASLRRSKAVKEWMDASQDHASYIKQLSEVEAEEHRLNLEVKRRRQLLTIAEEQMEAEVKAKRAEASGFILRMRFNAQPGEEDVVHDKEVAIEQEVCRFRQKKEDDLELDRSMLRSLEQKLKNTRDSGITAHARWACSGALVRNSAVMKDVSWDDLTSGMAQLEKSAGVVRELRDKIPKKLNKTSEDDLSGTGVSRQLFAGSGASGSGVQHKHRSAKHRKQHGVSSGPQKQVSSSSESAEKGYDRDSGDLVPMKRKKRVQKK